MQTNLPEDLFAIGIVSRPEGWCRGYQRAIVRVRKPNVGLAFVAPIRTFLVAADFARKPKRTRRPFFNVVFKFAKVIVEIKKAAILIAAFH
jgi:hypothetical protein